jgi:hypothetical protein
MANGLLRMKGVKEMSFVNEAAWDRIVRVLLGVVLLFLGITGVVGGGVALFLEIIGLVFTITGLVGFCPLYAIAKFRTNHAS